MLGRTRKRASTSKLPTVHGYLIGSEIASGPFSSIRTGFTSPGFHEYAIKIISKRKLQSMPGSATIITGETIIAPLLYHPHIINIREVFEVDDQIYQVMDFVKEGDLYTYLHRHTLTNKQKIDIADSILSAVEYLHLHLICHRDIKLENILFDPNKSALLSDFGFSTYAIKPSTGKFGSRGYAAPEIFVKSQYDGIKADVWSIGVLLYYLFKGFFPFKESTDLNIFLENLSAADSIDYSGLPQGLEEIIRACFRLPSDRPSITEIRSSDFFNQCTGRVENPSSVFKYQEPIPDVSSQFAGKIAQHCNVPIQKAITKLGEPGISEFKILYALVQNISDFFNKEADGSSSKPESPLISAFASIGTRTNSSDQIWDLAAVPPPKY